MKVIETNDTEETYRAAEHLAGKLHPGTVIALTGELGTGKTVMAKGIAAGLGIKEHVSSPTFNIVRQYDDGRMPLYHFDVYRISDISEMDETGYEDCFYGNGVTVIEWADMISDILPEDTIRITIKKDIERGFDLRRIEIDDEKYEYPLD